MSCHKRIGMTDQGLFKNRCMTVGQEWCDIPNISKPLRNDEFMMIVAEEEMFIWRFSKIFRGYSNKIFYSPPVNIQFWKTATKKR